MSNYVTPTPAMTKQTMLRQIKSKLFTPWNQQGRRQQLLLNRSAQFDSAWAGNKKSKQIPCAAMSFSLFYLNFKWKMLVVMVSMNYINICGST